MSTYLTSRRSTPARRPSARRSLSRCSAPSTSSRRAARQRVTNDAIQELAIGHASGGLVLPGFHRGGAIADPASTGGWLVTWRTAGDLRGARFADLDGMRLDPAVMVLALGSSRPHAYA